MEGFVTIEMRFKVTTVNDGLLVKMEGKCIDGCNEVALRLGEQKVDRSAYECRAKRKWNAEKILPGKFYREYEFSCKESVERFFDMLTEEP